MNELPASLTNSRRTVAPALSSSFKADAHAGVLVVAAAQIRPPPWRRTGGGRHYRRSGGKVGPSAPTRGSDCDHTLNLASASAATSPEAPPCKSGGGSGVTKRLGSMALATALPGTTRRCGLAGAGWPAAADTGAWQSTAEEQAAAWWGHLGRASASARAWSFSELWGWSIMRAVSGLRRMCNPEVMYATEMAGSNSNARRTGRLWLM